MIAPNAPKTKPQLKKIWAAARELGLDEDLLRGLSLAVTGSESIAALSKAQAAMLIDELEARKTGDFRPGMASRRQLWLIKKLAEELGWADDPRRLRGFLKKYAKVEDLTWLTGEAAYKIIEGLKKIKARQA